MKQKRWMKSVLKAAAETQVAMPWQRGARRAQTIARRVTTPSAKAKLAEA